MKRFDADERLDAGMELRGVERLDQKVVAARLDPPQPIPAVRLGRHDDDRHESGDAHVSQAAAELEALTARGDEIHEDEIRGLDFAGSKCALDGVHD